MTFVVEAYVSAAITDEPDLTIARTAAAVAQIAAAGEGIRYLRSIFIPEDETCLLVFEAESADIVRSTVALAGLDPDRVAWAESRERRPSRRETS
jgi:hypothetical protein